MMSPRNAGSVTPSRVSVSELRGLAYCPAMRPILITGRLAPYVSTTAICRIVLILLRMLSAVAVLNVSAQSPPWSRNASPRPAAASCAREVVGLAGEDERRERGQLRRHGVERGRVRPLRLLERAHRPPGVQPGDDLRVRLDAHEWLAGTRG